MPAAMINRIGRSLNSHALRRFACLAVVSATVAASVAVAVRGAAPVRYRFTFPEPEHRWMQVEASFVDLGTAPLELRMSRSSPGRYSLHDFAKNVYDVHAVAPDGRELQTTRPDPYGWNVTDHGAAVSVKYKIYGDRVDGTYLAIDRTHAHINMPAAVMWAHGLEDRPATLLFEPPSGANWQVATQLHGDRFEFTAPNLQYLMDSPAEFGPVAMRQFNVGARTNRDDAPSRHCNAAVFDNATRLVHRHDRATEYEKLGRLPASLSGGV